jgi:hypothetical protein
MQAGDLDPRVLGPITATSAPASARPRQCRARRAIDDFRETGLLDTLDPRTRKRMPNRSIELRDQRKISERISAGRAPDRRLLYESAANKKAPANAGAFESLRREEISTSQQPDRPSDS